MEQHEGYASCSIFTLHFLRLYWPTDLRAPFLLPKLALALSLNKEVLQINDKKYCKRRRDGKTDELKSGEIENLNEKEP